MFISFSSSQREDLKVRIHSRPLFLLLTLESFQCLASEVDTFCIKMVYYVFVYSMFSV